MENIFIKKVKSLIDDKTDLNDFFLPNGTEEFIMIAFLISNTFKGHCTSIHMNVVYTIFDTVFV